MVAITPEQLVRLAGDLAKDKKATRPVVLVLSEVSIVTDYFLIASAQSRVQTNAIAEHIQDELSNHGVTLHSRESDQDGRWHLLDYGTMVVHVFQEETREFYNLERLWGEARLIEL